MTLKEVEQRLQMALNADPVDETALWLLLLDLRAWLS